MTTKRKKASTGARALPAIVRVEWLDAVFHQGENDDAPSVIQTSVGYVVEKSRRCIKLSQSITRYSDCDEPQEILTIPRAYVTSITVLQEAE